jgi:hypothetical protein
MRPEGDGEDLKGDGEDLDWYQYEEYLGIATQRIALPNLGLAMA